VPIIKNPTTVYDFILLLGHSLPFLYYCFVTVYHFYATALSPFTISMLLSGFCLTFYVTALLLFETLPQLLTVSQLKPHILFRLPYKISELVLLYILFETRPVRAVSVLCT